MDRLKEISIGLCAGILLAGCTGKADSRGGVGIDLDGIERTAAVLYRENMDEAAHDARPYGGGVFVSRTISSKRRFFLVTANHVAVFLRYQRGFRAVQVGMAKKGEVGKILRATMPENGVKWFEGDEFHDIAAADITDSLYGLDALGACILFVDLDIPHKSAVGDACVCVAAAGKKKSDFASPKLDLWTSPFARKEGKVVATGVDRKHEYTFGQAVGSRMQHRVDVATAVCAEGDSGSPVFVMPGDGTGRFCGIAIGAARGTVNMVSADAIARYIDASCGVNLTKEPLADEALREVEVVTVRGGDGEENMNLFGTWRPGIRRIVLEVAGICTKSNALDASVGMYYGKEGLIQGEEIALTVGWNNIDPEGKSSKPGFKKAVLTFDLDETGRTIGRNVKSDDFTMDSGGEPRSVADMKYSREWNMVKIRTRGGYSADSYARVIKYAAKE